MGGISTSSGKKPAQKYQNSFAFVPNKYSKKAMEIASIPITGCCLKCVEILQYKQKFGKYKPLTQPKTCLKCHLKKIKCAYHVVCEECATEDTVCAKCRVPFEREVVKSTAEIIKEEQALKMTLAALSERHRRSYQRKIDRGDEEGALLMLEKAKKNEFEDFDDFEDEFSDLDE